jgi:hypothetical protein
MQTHRLQQLMSGGNTWIVSHCADAPCRTDHVLRFLLVNGSITHA